MEPSFTNVILYWGTVIYCVCILCVFYPWTVPTGSPEFSLGSESPTTITVTWDELRPHRANGIIISYGITYCRANSVYCNMTTVDGDLEEYTLRGLTPNSNYSVSMAASTVVGQGSYSGNVTVETPRNINETSKLVSSVSWLIAEREWVVESS